MEYDIDSFTIRLMALLRDNVPFESDELNNSKHPNRHGRHLRDLFSVQYRKELDMLPDAFNTSIEQNIDTRTFEVGGAMAEALMPHYHILQQAEVIRKRGRGTKTSLGSQQKVATMERDYEKVSWNGKTFSKEYTKNVRGERSKAAKIRAPKLRYSGGQYYEDRRGIGNSYINIHYKYIDRILDAIVPYLASEFGLQARRKIDSGLEEEYNLQVEQDLNDRYTMLDIFDSFEE